MKASIVVAATLWLCAFAPVKSVAEQADPLDAVIAHGRYLVKITGCNDCHTAGYTVSGGNLPESEWLKGDAIGWRGPWGTTYPINLRLYVSRLTEDQWITVVKTARSRPPMPWWALHEMKDQDLRAMYTFIRSLSGTGDEAPQALAPEATPGTPYFTLVFPQ